VGAAQRMESSGGEVEGDCRLSLELVVTQAEDGCRSAGCRK